MNKCNPAKLNHVAHCNSHTNKFRLSQPSKWRTGKEKLLSVRASTMKSSGFYLISFCWKNIYTPASAVSEWSYSRRLIFEQMSKHEVRRHMYIIVRRGKGRIAHDLVATFDRERVCARAHDTDSIRKNENKTVIRTCKVNLPFSLRFRRRLLLLLLLLRFSFSNQQPCIQYNPQVYLPK